MGSYAMPMGIYLLMRVIQQRSKASLQPPVQQVASSTLICNDNLSNFKEAQLPLLSVTHLEKNQLGHISFVIANYRLGHNGHPL